MPGISERFRHELKFLIDTGEAIILARRLGNILNRDIHSNERGSYKVSSLYFDGIRRDAFFQKIDGVDERRKYRIRTYNDDDCCIRLEVKERRNGAVRKFHQTLTAEEYARLVFHRDDSFLLESRSKAGLDFFSRRRESGLGPILIIDYIRQAFVHPYGNVRITFDSGIRVRTGTADLFTRAHARSVLPKGSVILEIKYDNYLPLHLRGLIRLENKPQLALSKYAICFQRK